ncbi:Protein-arginine deiminase type-3 [Larimichthys crocea]|uniref:Uncharacterized protein n=1 Tax=Larimichthys crocea TaxID=215358 RepID=A0ACD3RJL2_LARCR|nr:Protein-arginine deiminase type-3 [Larimichthys crocea]
MSCIDWNRDVLKRELGLVDEDIIDVPILFRPWEDAAKPRAVAYYPDMLESGFRAYWPEEQASSQTYSAKPADR